MGNPAGYLFRVGQSAARRARNKHGFLPTPPPGGLPDVEPGLIPALEGLSESQRVCVVLVHALDWSPTEVAELLDVHVSSVRTHIRRGLTRLHEALEVRSNAG
jgi:DNA-directed RNA polymerase specialized sigma24 family protein